MKVLYEDNHLIVAVKPPMVPTQPDSSGDADMLGMVREYVRCRYHKQGNVYIGLLHRLDRPVGGVMVFARTSKAASRLSEQIRSGGMEKEYLAVVHGCPPEEGLFEDYLIKDASHNLVKPVREGTPGAKYARLEYALEARRGKHSLVRIRLHTGRPHQIRVQFASRGYPLLGDVRYGKGEPGRIALYSTRIAFEHPVRRERMEFENIPTGGFFEEFTGAEPANDFPFFRKNE